MGASGGAEPPQLNFWEPIFRSTYLYFPVNVVSLETVAGVDGMPRKLATAVVDGEDSQSLSVRWHGVAEAAPGTLMRLRLELVSPAVLYGFQIQGCCDDC